MSVVNAKSFNKNVVVASLIDEDINILLNIKNEEDEIAHLQLGMSLSQDIKVEEKEASLPIDKHMPKIEFHCSSCGLHELVDYFGREPPFLYGIEFVESAYVLRNPFALPSSHCKPKAESFVVFGAECCVCGRVVCKDTECSYFYTNTTCLKCAPIIYNTLPMEMQTKLSKMLYTNKKK